MAVVGNIRRVAVDMYNGQSRRALRSRGRAPTVSAAQTTQKWKGRSMHSGLSVA
jgi:hypothetical protein